MGAWLALDPIVKCSLSSVHQHLNRGAKATILRGLLVSPPREQEKKAQMDRTTTAGDRRIAGHGRDSRWRFLGGARQEQMLSAPNRAETLTIPRARRAGSKDLREALDVESCAQFIAGRRADTKSANWFDKLWRCRARNTVSWDAIPGNFFKPTSCWVTTRLRLVEGLANLAAANRDFDACAGGVLIRVAATKRDGIALTPAGNRAAARLPAGWKAMPSPFVAATK